MRTSSLLMASALALAPAATENTASGESLADTLDTTLSVPTCGNGEQMRQQVTRLLSQQGADKTITQFVGRMVLEQDNNGAYTQTPESIRERLIARFADEMAAASSFFALRTAGTAIRGVYAKGERSITALKAAEALAGTEADVLKILKKG